MRRDEEEQAMLRPSILLASMFLALNGCGSEAFEKNATAISTGCRRNDVEIASEQTVSGLGRWDALCGGRTFHCEGTTLADTSCLPDPPQPPRPVTAAVAAKQPAPAPQRREWIRVVKKDCAASFLMPGVPAEKRESVKTAAGSISTYTATAGTEEQPVLVSCATLPGTAPVNVGTVFDRASDLLLGNIGATIESEQDLDLGDASARDVRFSWHGESGRARLVLRNRVLATLFIGPLRAFSNEEVTAFFASFKSIHQTATDEQ